MEFKTQEIKRPSHFDKAMPEAVSEKFTGDLAENYESIKNKGVQALRKGGRIMENIEQARKANLADPTQTSASAAVNTYQYSDKKMDTLINSVGDAANEVQRTIEQLDNEINEPITEKAEHARFAKDAQQHVKSLEEEERGKFVRERIKSEDWETVSYILGAPFYATGLGEDERESLIQEYKNERFEEEMKLKEAFQFLSKQLHGGMKAAIANAKALDTPAVHEAIEKSKYAKTTMGK